MAEVIKVKNNHADFKKVIALLFEKGVEQDSRNGKTLEIQDLIIEVENPLEMAPNGVRPNYLPEIGWVEGLQLIAGITDSALTTQVQPNFRAFMEHEDAKFWGAYGPRTVDQFPIVVERLREDPDTRQAVITLWDPEYDAAGGKKDHPCTTAFVFQIRDGKLDMSTLMRSNDLWWGWPYDSQQFAMVQLTVAGVLGIPVGKYTHHAASAHLYEPHWEVARETLAKTSVDHPALQTPMFVGDTWEEVRERAFTTYRVITQTLPVKELKTHDEWTVARALMSRRALTLYKERERIADLEF